jgi:hypothetical protein
MTVLGQFSPRLLAVLLVSTVLCRLSKAVSISTVDR